jgi:perosamine synthetase
MKSLIRPNLPLKETLLPVLEDVLYSGSINEGELVYEFENGLCDYLNTPNLLAVSSGSAAIDIAFILAGIVPGDEVISTSLTAEPTNTCLTARGATVRFADIDLDTGCIGVDGIRAAMTDKTKAVMVVHYGGYPAHIEEIADYCRKHELVLIEDCAHAFDAKVSGSAVGNFGDFGIFSFQAIKQITTIEGGAITYRDASLTDKIKKMRWFGLSKTVSRAENNIDIQGYKYNFNNVHAAIGIQQLAEYRDKHAWVKCIAQQYNDQIDALCAIERLPDRACVEPSYWLYTVLTDRAEEFISFFSSKGIEASKIHKLTHEHGIFCADDFIPDRLPKFFEKMVHIPIGPWLSDRDVLLVCDALSDWDAQLRQ